MVSGWSSIVAMVEAHFAIAIRGEGWVGIRHRSGSTATKIKIEVRSALGRPWVVVTADVLSAKNLLPDTALAVNWNLEVGALHLEDDQLLLRHQLPATDLDVVDLRRVIHYLGIQAGRIRAQARMPAVLDYCVF